MMETVFKTALRGLFKTLVGPPMPIGFQRAWATALTATNLNARGVERSTETLGGVRCEVLSHGVPDPGRAIVWLHGGAYIIGSPATCRSITSFLAAESRATVIVPHYRLAPEHPYPAGLDDAIAVVGAAIERYGRIMLGGDSAGGGLSLCTAQALRDRSLPQVECLALISPWVDLGDDAPSRSERESRDPMLRRSWTEQAVRGYIGDGDPKDPRWSPLFGDLSTLPRTLIHVGTEEMLYDDAVRLDAGLRKAGTESQLREFEGLWHDFHMHAAMLSKARGAVRELAGFLG